VPIAGVSCRDAFSEYCTLKGNTRAELLDVPRKVGTLWALLMARHGAPLQRFNWVFGRIQGPTKAGMFARRVIIMTFSNGSSVDSKQAGGMIISAEQVENNKRFNARYTQ
jgi:hypothetical protein